LGHTKIESTVRYPGIEVDDALSISEQVDLWEKQPSRLDQEKNRDAHFDGICLSCAKRAP
jgi:hypothetical protein